MKRVRNASAPSSPPQESPCAPDHLSQLPHELWEHMISMGELTSRDRANWAEVACVFREAIGRVHRVALHAMTEWRPHSFDAKSRIRPCQIGPDGDIFPMDHVRAVDYNRWLQFQLCTPRPLSELLPDWWTPDRQQQGLQLDQWHDDPRVQIERDAQFSNPNYCSAVAGGYVTQVLLNLMQMSPPAGMTATVKTIDTHTWTSPDIDIFYGGTPTGSAIGNYSFARNPILRWVTHVRRCMSNNDTTAGSGSGSESGGGPVRWRANQNVIDLDNGKVHVQFINIGAEYPGLNIPAGVFAGAHLGSAALEATVADFDMTCCQLAVSLESGTVVASPAAVAALLTGQVLVTPTLSKNSIMETVAAAALHGGLTLDAEVLHPDRRFFAGIGARRTRSYIRRMAKYQRRGFELSIPLIPVYMRERREAPRLRAAREAHAQLFLGGESAPALLEMRKPDAQLRVQIIRVSGAMAAAAHEADALLAAVDPSNGMACYDFLHDNDPMWETAVLPGIGHTPSRTWFHIGHNDDSKLLWISIFYALADDFSLIGDGDRTALPSVDTFLSGTIERVRKSNTRQSRTGDGYRYRLQFDELSECIVENGKMGHPKVVRAIAEARAAGTITV